MRAFVARPRQAGLELARMLATLAWVVAGTAIVLGGLGAIPALLGRDASAARAVPTVDEAERRLGTRLAVPGFFPARLAWPPAEIRVAGHRGGSVRMTFHPRQGGKPIVLVQAAPGGEIAPALLGGAREITGRRTTVGGRPARLADVLVDGETWAELTWALGDRPLVLRTRGDVEELYAMARSVRVEGGP